MRVLIFGNTTYHTNSLSTMLSAMPIDIDIHEAFNEKECLDYLDYNEYDHIFTERSHIKHELILDSILSSNPRQSVVILNEKDECLSGHSCQVCCEKYNKKNVILPLTKEQLPSILCNKFECENKNRCSDQIRIEKIGKEVRSMFPGIQISIENNIFILEHIANPLKSRVFLTLISCLNENAIDYTLVKNDNIKVSRCLNQLFL